MVRLVRGVDQLPGSSMGNGMNKVLPGLYVGNFRDSRDEEQLKANKITHILSIHDNAKPTRQDMIYLCLSAHDVGTQDLCQYFQQSNDFIHSARIYGGNVLIHCLAGMSRSVTLTVAYIMSITSLGWRDALNIVRVSRSVANPNYGFQKQLLAFQHEGVEQARQSLQRKYEKAAESLDDVRYVQKVLDEYESQKIIDRVKRESQHRSPHSDLRPPTVSEATADYIQNMNNHSQPSSSYAGSDDHMPLEQEDIDYRAMLLNDIFVLPKSAKSSLIVTLKVNKDSMPTENPARRRPIRKMEPQENQEVQAVEENQLNKRQALDNHSSETASMETPCGETPSEENQAIAGFDAHSTTDTGLTISGRGNNVESACTIISSVDDFATSSSQ